MKQFSIQKLFLLTGLVAVLVAFVSHEPVGIVSASLFCLVSWLGIFALTAASLKHLVEAVESSFKERDFAKLTERFRWAYLDGSAIAWLIITIVISNYVLENSIANGKYLIAVGWLVFLIAIVANVAGHFVARKKAGS